MSEQNIVTSKRTDTEVFVYGAKHLEKGRLKADNGDYLVDDQGNKLKFFTLVEDK